jgi:LacI family transcriptional regulator
MPITQADVAQRAGVSIKQVSRVINNEDRVAAPTRRRVLEAIEELGYVPNVWAQRLARGTSRLVGLCYHDATAAYISEVLRGMMDAADRHHYRVGLYRFDPHDARQVANMVGIAAHSRADAFVLTPPCDNAAAFVEALEASDVPYVRLTPQERTGTAPWVAATDEQGAYEATAHLIALGHTRIGCIQGNVEHAASWERRRGHFRALDEAGIETPADYMQQGDWSFATGLRCARALLDLPLPPTAIVASCDDAATGVIQAIWERGWACPGQVSVVGFDDNPVAQQVWPPLTTVHQPIYEIAGTAMSLLVERLIPGEEPADGSLPTHLVLPTQLVVRRSTAPVAWGSSSLR